jgi:hypothetical protein
MARRWKRTVLHRSRRQAAAVPVSPGDTPKFGAPIALFQTQQREGGGGYTPSPDGQRFLINAPLGPADTDPISVIVNWRAAIDKQ